jgi:hypothetical protein
MKRIVVSLLMLLAINAAFAQKYVRINLGYNLPINSGLLAVEQKYNGATSRYTYEGVYGSYGSGLSAHVAFGGGFGNGIMGYDVELGFLKGKKYETTSGSINGNFNSTTTYNVQATSFQFAPSVTFTAGTGNIHPFARIGPVIAMTSIKDHGEWQNTNSPKYVMEYKYSGGIAFGFKGVVGVAFTLNELMDLFAEVDFISMSYSPKKRKVQEYTEDGDDITDDLDPKRLEEDLEKEYEVGGEEYFPPVRKPLPMGSLGIQLGIKFKF